MIEVVYSDQNVLDLKMAERWLAMDPCLIEHFNWKTDLKLYDGPGTIIHRSSHQGGDSVLIEVNPDRPSGRPTSLVSVNLNSGRAFVVVAATTHDQIGKTIAKIREAVPVSDVTGTRRPVSFWSDHQRGPRSVTRLLDVPRWEEIAFNYPERIARKLAELTVFEPTTAGQLILWRGVPGTGKTWMLRALVREWEWADFHYITDPDAFFGSNASYMLDVILNDDDDDEDGPLSRKWKVLVLEDAGEMLARDARERTGQGLSRLLNLVDGMIGQGLRVLVLVTTNEELKKLHPAIARPGRCAANIEFATMYSLDVERWAITQGLPEDFHVPGRPSPTIAELYARANGSQVDDDVERGSVGFMA